MPKLTELRLSGLPSDGNAPTTCGRVHHHLVGRPSNNRHTAENFPVRFWAKVERRGPDECWPWRGNVLPSGRGQVHVRWEGTRNVRQNAPVVAWELANGRAVPAGLVVAHACDNPNCVNPSHLTACTQAENVHDSIRKGRYNTFGIQKLNAEQVREIRRRAKTGEVQKTIAKTFGIARNTVSGIVNRQTWAHLNDHPALDAVFERVPHVILPVVGELHTGDSTQPYPQNHYKTVEVR